MRWDFVWISIGQKFLLSIFRTKSLYGFYVKKLKAKYIEPDLEFLSV